MRTSKILLTAALVFGIGAAGAAASSAFHFALRSSVPAADATVSAPAEVRLIFTEAPGDNSVGIRLISPAGAAVATTQPAVDPENATQYFVKPNAALAAGRYTVSWRGIGDDGHAVNGEFGFTVSAQ